MKLFLAAHPRRPATSSRRSLSTGGSRDDTFTGLFRWPFSQTDVVSRHRFITLFCPWETQQIHHLLSFMFSFWKVCLSGRISDVRLCICLKFFYIFLSVSVHRHSSLPIKNYLFILVKQCGWFFFLYENWRKLRIYTWEFRSEEPIRNVHVVGICLFRSLVLFSSVPTVASLKLSSMPFLKIFKMLLECLLKMQSPLVNSKRKDSGIAVWLMSL